MDRKQLKKKQEEQNETSNRKDNDNNIIISRLESLLEAYTLASGYF